MSISDLETFFDKSLKGILRGHVVVGGRTYEYRQWDGEQLSSALLSIDTETRLCEYGKVPELAIGQVFDGESVYLIPPDVMGPFIRQHRSAAYICHNASFDWHVVYKHFLKNDRSAAVVWLSVVDEDRLSDTMLLDQLVRIAYGSKNPVPRNLSLVAQHWADATEVDKDDPWRLRYGEIIGEDWRDVDSAAWEYAAIDPIATRMAFLKLRDAVRKLVRKHRIDPTTLKTYGPLSIRLQVKAAIALHATELNGIKIDQGRRSQAENDLRRRLDDLVQRLGEYPDFQAVFRRDKQGRLMLTPAGKPRIIQNELRRVLQKIAEEGDFSPPTTPTGQMSLARSYWQEHSQAAPFIDCWLQLEETAKLLQFFDKLQVGRIHPRYTTVVRTGRTSCHGPNIQQMPRSGRFREMFVPRPGYVFLIIDYAALELRTLAAVCEDRIGYSVLGDTIREGRDPHCYTASLLSDFEYEQFLDLKETNPDTFKQNRQAAKAINFGVPGGLGAAALSQYARLNYGTDLTEDQAAIFRRQFLNDIYPEIGQYMQSDTVRVLASNLFCRASDVPRAFPTDGGLGAAKRIVQGLGKRNGDDYNPQYVQQVWRRLSDLNRAEHLEQALEAQQTGEDLERKLFFGTTITTTGRIRGRTTFTQSKNTPFQGLAADGAKIGLWQLFREGFRTVCHVHDEFLIELSEKIDLSAAADRINQICCESMQQVTGSIPVKCEYAITSCWSKNAELVRDQDGNIEVWEPDN